MKYFEIPDLKAHLRLLFVTEDYTEAFIRMIRGARFALDEG